MHAGPFVARFSTEYTQIGSSLGHVHTIRQYLELLVIDHLASTFARAATFAPVLTGESCLALGSFQVNDEKEECILARLHYFTNTLYFSINCSIEDDISLYICIIC